MEKIFLTLFAFILLPYAGLPSYIDQFIIMLLVILFSWLIYEYAKKTLDVHHVHLPHLRPLVHGPVSQVLPVRQSKPRVRKPKQAPAATEVLDLKNDPATPMFFTEDEKLDIKRTVQARTRKKAAE